MIAGQRIVGLIVCLWLVADVALGGDDGAEGRWRCPYTEDGTCIPNPRSYGYYPTRWRKWPAAKPAQEAVPTPKPAQAEPPQEPAKETEELPPGDNPPAGATDMPPDQSLPEAMPPETPQQPDEPQTQPELPPELKSDLPQPPDLENLLPEEGPEEPPMPPAKREPKAIPADDDPFKDDPLPGEDGMGGAAQRPKSPVPSGTGQTKPPAPTATSQVTSSAPSTTGRMHWRPDPRVKQSTCNPIRNSQSVTANVQEIHKPIAAAAAVAKATPVKQLAPIRASQIVTADVQEIHKPIAAAAEATPDKQCSLAPIRASQIVTADVQEIHKPIAAAAAVAEATPVKQSSRNPIRTSQIVLADAQGIRKPISTAAAATEATPVKLTRSRTNPLRSATSGMVLPCPVADEEVVPAAQWSADGAAPQASGADPSAAAGWRANPLRAEH